MTQSLEQMVETLRASLSVNPRDAWKRLRLGKLLARLRRHEEAIETLQRALRDDPKLADAHVALAGVYAAREQVGEQERELLEALELQPRHIDGGFELARLRATQKRHQEAIELLAHVEDKGQDELRILRARGASEAALGKWADSMVRYERAAELYPDNVDVREDLGMAYAANSWWRKAETTLGEALEMDANRILARRGLLRTYLAMESGNSALAMAEALLAAVPADPEATRGKAKALLLLGRAAEALPLVSNSLEDPEEVLARCHALLAVHRRDDAVRHANEAAAKHPGSAIAQWTLGLVLFELAREQEAVAPLRQAIRLDPQLVEAHATMARALVPQGRTREALQAMEQACAMRPSDAALLVLRGELELTSEMPQQAEASFLKATQLDDTSAAARLGLGRALAAQGRPGEAIENYRQALDLDPSSGEVWLDLGRLELEELRLEDASRSLTEATSRLPESVEALQLLGEALFALRRVDEAIEAQVRATDKNAEDAELWLALGRSYAEVRRDPDAVRVLERATALDPRLGGAFDLLGRELVALHRDEEAAEALAQAANLLPSEASVFRELGLVQSRLERWQDAVDTLSAAVERGAEEPAVLGALAEGFLALNRAVDADQWFERVVPLEPAVATHRAGRARALAALGREPEAEAELLEAVKLDPRHAGAQQQLGRIRLARGDATGALPCLEVAAEGFFDAPEAWADLGAAGLGAGAMREAERAFRRLGELKPTDPNAASGLAQALEGQDAFNEAIDTYRRACALRPGALDDQRRLGLLLARLGRDEEAIRELTPALASSTDAEKLEVLADCLLKETQLEAATEVLERAIAAKADLHAKAGLHAKVGLAYAKIDREAQAIRHLERASEGGTPPAEVIDVLGQLHLVAARRHLNSRDLSPAIDSFERAAALRPDDIELRWELCQALRDEGRTERATEVAHEAVRRAPSDARFPLLLGEMALQQERPEEALSAFDNARRLDPQGFRAMRGRARSLVVLGRADEAIAELRAAIEVKPEAVDELAMLGDLLLAADRAEEALPVLTELVEERPLDVDANRMLGHCLQRVGRHDAAVSPLRRAATREEKDDDLKRSLATSLVVLKRWEEALPVLEAVATEPQPHESLGRVLAALERHAEAVPHLQQAVQQRSDPDLWLLLAHCSLESSDASAAGEAAAQVLEERPGDVPALRIAAAAARSRGDAQGAARALQLLLANAPDDQAAREARAQLLLAEAQESRDPEAAIERFRECVELVPRNPAGYLGLGRALERVGDPQEALQVVRQGLQAGERSAELQHLEGTLLRAAGMNEEAVTAYERAIEIDAENVSALFDLAQLRVRMGQPEAAASLLEELLEVEGAHEGALHLLAGLLHELGRHRAAAEAFERLRAQVELGAEEQAAFGLSLAALERHEEARGVLAAVVGELPGRADVVLALAGAMRALEQQEAARDALSAAAERMPANRAIFLELARAQGGCGDWAEAAATYQQVAAGETDESVLREWVEAGTRANQLDQRVAALTRLSQALPEDVCIMKDLARGLQSAGRLEPAAAVLERALALADDRAVRRQLTEVELELAQVGDPPDVEWLALAVDHGQDEPELLVEAAQLLRRAGDLSAARGAAEAAIEGAPNDAHAGILLGELLEALDERERAVPVYRQALRAQVDSREGLMGLTRVLLHLGDPEAAVSVERLVKLDAKDVEVLELAGRAHELAGQKALAVERWRSLLELQSDRVEVLTRVARLLGELERHPERIELLAERHPTPELTLMLAQSSLAKGEAGRAASLVGAILEGEVAGEANAIHGRSLVALGADEQAIDAFDRAIHLGVTDVESEMRAVAARLGQGLPFDQATPLLRRVLDCCPTAHELWRLLAERELASGTPQRALDAARQALEHGADASTWRIVGTAYERVGDTAAAAEAFANAAESNPTDAEAALGVARARRAAGEHDGAVAALTRLVAEDPKNTTATMLLADSYDELGRREDAVRYWKRLFDASDLPASECGRLGLRLLELDRASEAVEALEEALEGGADAALLLALGDARIRGGRPQDAVAPLQKARSLGAPATALLVQAQFEAEEYAAAIESAREAPSLDEPTVQRVLDAAGRLGDAAAEEAALQRLFELTRDPAIVLRLADLLERVGRPLEGIEALRQANPADDSEVRQRLVQLTMAQSRVAIANGTPERASTLLGRVLDLEIPAAQLVEMARLAVESSAPELAQRAAERAALSSNPDAAHGAHLVLAALARAAERVDDARGHYEAALKVRMDSMDALTGAAWCVAHKGEGDWGAQWLLRAARLDPAHSGTRALLSDVVARTPKSEFVAVFEHIVGARGDDLAARTELGKLLARLERRSDAVVHLRVALDLGADPETLALLAEIETGLGENQRAVAAAERALEMSPDHALAKQWRAVALAGTAPPDALASVLAEIDRQRLTEPQASRLATRLAERAREFEAAGEVGAAEAVYAKVQILDAGQGMKQALLGARVALEAGDLHLASQRARAAIETNPQDLEAHVFLGDVCVRVGADEEALQAFAAALKIDRGNLAALRGHGLVAERLGQHEAAQASLGVATEQDANAETLAALSRSLEALGRSDETVAALRRLGEFRPLELSEEQRLGRLLFRAGNAADAVPHLEAAAATHQPELLWDLGHAKLAAGDPKGGFATLRRLEEQNPRYEGLQARLGLLLLERQELKPALEALERALEQEGDRAELLEAACTAAEALEDRPALMRFGARLAEVAPKPDVLLSLGRTRFEAGDFEGAATALSRAMELGAASTEVRTQLADALGEHAREQCEGNPQGAVATYRRALQIDAERGDDWIRLGMLEIQAGDPNRGRESLARGCATGNASPEALGEALQKAEQNRDAQLAVAAGEGLMAASPSAVAARRLAQAYEALGRRLEALQNFERASTLDSRDIASLMAAARLRYEAGEMDSALEHVQSVVAVEPANRVAQKLRAELLVQKGQFAEALPILQWLANEEPSLDSLTKLGYCHGYLKQPAQQAAVLTSALRYAPNDVRLLTQLGDAQAIDGDLKSALTTFERAFALDQTPEVKGRVAEAALRLGNQAMADGNFDEALKWLLRAENAAPKRQEVLDGLIRSALGVNNGQLACGTARKLMQVDPKHLDLRVIHQLVRVAQEAEQYGEAHYWCEVGLNRDARDPGLLYRMGVLVMGRDPQAAIGYLRRCIEVDHSHRGSKLALARALVTSGDVDQAIVVLSRAMEEAPNDGEIQELMGLTLVLAKRHAEAARYLERCIQVGRETGEAQVGIADCALFRGDVRRAQAALERALVVDPHSVKAMIRLGSIALLQGDGNQALGYLNRAAGIAPNDARVRFELATVHLRMKQYELARREHDILVKLDPKLAAQVRSLFPT